MTVMTSLRQILFALCVLAVRTQAVAAEGPTSTRQDGQLVELIFVDPFEDRSCRVWLSRNGPANGTLRRRLPLEVMDAHRRTLRTMRQRGIPARKTLPEKGMQVKLDAGEIVVSVAPELPLVQPQRFEPEGASAYTPPAVDVLGVAALGRSDDVAFALSGSSGTRILHTRADHLDAALDLNACLVAVGLQQVPDLPAETVAALVQFAVTGGLLVLVDNAPGGLPDIPPVLRPFLPVSLSHEKVAMAPAVLDWLVSLGGQQAADWKVAREGRHMRRPGVEAPSRARPNWVPARVESVGLGAAVYLSFDPYEGHAVFAENGVEDPLVTAVQPFLSSHRTGRRLLRACHEELRQVAIADRLEEDIMPRLPIGLAWPISGSVALLLTAVAFAALWSLRRRRRIGDVLYVLMFVVLSAGACLVMWGLSRRNVNREWEVIHSIAVPAPHLSRIYRKQVCVKWSVLPTVDAAPLDSTTRDDVAPAIHTHYRPSISGPFVPRIRSTWTSALQEQSLPIELTETEHAGNCQLTIRNLSDTDFSSVRLFTPPGNEQAGEFPGNQATVIDVGSLPAGQDRPIDRPVHTADADGPDDAKTYSLGQQIAERFAPYADLGRNEYWVLAVAGGDATQSPSKPGHRVLITRVPRRKLTASRASTNEERLKVGSYLLKTESTFGGLRDPLNAPDRAVLLRLQGPTDGAAGAAAAKVKPSAGTTGEAGDLMLHGFCWRVQHGSSPDGSTGTSVPASTNAAGEARNSGRTKLNVSLFDMRQGVWTAVGEHEWIPPTERDTRALAEMVQRYRAWRAAVDPDHGPKTPPTDLISFAVPDIERFVDPRRGEVLVRLRQQGRQRRASFAAVELAPQRRGRRDDSYLEQRPNP